MYDFVAPKRNAKLKTFDLGADLSTPEVSFDLQSFIDQVPAADSLLVDILTDERTVNIPSVNFAFPMPQSAGFGSDRYGSEAGVKQEPAPGIETHSGFGRSYPITAGLPDAEDIGSQTAERKSKKAIDKASDEYRRRRERNNIAVRKSREKAKQRCKDTERRVGDLVSENDKLRKRVELLNKELSVLKNLLSNVGQSKGLD